LGWDAFRAVESQILHDLLTAYPTNKIIACGGGVVELESNRLALQVFREHGIVMHVMREKDAVLKYLRECTHHPPFYHETAVEAWDRRVVWFRECSSFDFVSLTVDIPSAPEGSPETAITPEQTLALKPVEEEFFRLLRFIHGIDTNKVAVGPRTHRSYILCLTYKDVRDAVPVLDDLSQGIDMWEIRVDLLGSLDPTFLAFQVATLRRYSNLPILFTLRTVNQGGKYQEATDDTSALHSLLQYALRLGVEYLDLQVTYPKNIFMDLVARKGNTSIIGSYHNWSGNISWTSQETRQIYETLVQLGSDILNITNVAKTWEDNMSLREFVSSVEKNGTPLIAVNVFSQAGVEYEYFLSLVDVQFMQGKISRALNTTLSPVCHPLLPYPASPGQISFVECQQILHFTGLLPARKFYVFGNPIAESMSPTLHNTAFATLGLPHSYELHETDSVDPLVEVLQNPSFGGASITAPYKRDIMPYLMHVSRQAKIIGAVNNVTPIPGGFSGDNTEWRAIKTCILGSVTPANAVTASTTALIIGAGGTARAALYALYYIGVVNIFIYNRTKTHAQILADEFNKLDSLFCIRVLDSLSIPLPIHPQPTIILSTVPATSNSPTGPIEVDVGLNSEHLSSRGGVAVELAYQRRVTKLLALAEKKKDQGWVSVKVLNFFWSKVTNNSKYLLGGGFPRRRYGRRSWKCMSAM